MKLLILSLLIFTTTLHAENWLNHTKVKSGSIEAYSLKADCERVSQEKCFDLGEYPSTVFSEVDESVEDYSKPVYSKSEVQACATNAICDSTFAVKVCTDVTESPIKNYDLKQVYCSKFLSYEQKLQKTIALDAVKLAAYQAAKVLEASAALKEAGIQGALKRIECGKRVIGLLVLRNSSKVLTTANIAQINTVYAPIKSLIETGSLVTAKEYMLAITPDGVLITEADKSDLVAEINKCL